VRRLIVNADDFGLTLGVNRAVMQLHLKGILTSATLMARAPATEDAVALALKTPTLGVGCHIVLVDGEPLLPAREIPTLIDQTTGRFHPSLGAFLRRLLLGRIRSAEIEAEAAAQIELLQSRGVRLTHIDTHKHTHMFRAALSPLLRAARAAGIGAVRNPFEPDWSCRATAGAALVRRIQVDLLRLLEPASQRIVAEEGFATTNGALGMLATGTLNATNLTSLLRSIPPGTWELVTHPGYNDSDLDQVRTRLKASRETERRALLAIEPPDGVELVSFAHLNAAVAAGSH
jgi:chitin disaccharide deacetylase